MTSIADRQFRFNWRLSLFSAFFLVLFVNLGLWQLGRGEEKQQLMSAQEQLRQSKPIAVSDFEKLNRLSPGQPVSLSGVWVEQPQIFLDNVVLDGQVGYELLQLYSDRNQRQVLVNRGFVTMARTRADLPVLPSLAQQPAAGEVYKPELNQMVDPSVEQWATGVIRIQSLDSEAVAEALETELVPVVIRLAEDHPDALPRYWPVTNMLPEKHRGYAIQWFLMAVAVVIAWSYFSFPKPSQETEA